ncbi:hypothetical protein IWW50_006821, partial [Coemansia erecta]
MVAMYIERPTYKSTKPPVETRTFFQQLHWVHIVLLSTTPLIALYGFFTTALSLKTLAW